MTTKKQWQTAKADSSAALRNDKQNCAAERQTELRCGKTKQDCAAKRQTKKQ
jgi:hypothetical protein